MGPVSVLAVLMAALLTAACAGEQAEPSSAPTLNSVPISKEAPGAQPSRQSIVWPTSPPTEIPADGGITAPCELSLSVPTRHRQTAFLQWSPDGSSLVFDIEDLADKHRAMIWQVGVDGSYARRLADPAPSGAIESVFGFHADLSPDGRSLVYSTCKYKKDLDRKPNAERLLHIYELEVATLGEGEPLRLTNGAAAEHYPVWSPDGARVAYIGMKSNRSVYYSRGSAWLMTIKDDGNPGGTRELYTPPVSERAPVWSPDGTYLAVVTRAEGGGKYVHVADTRPDRSHLPSVEVGRTSISPTWSPDGAQLAFAENHGDRNSWEGSTIHIAARDGSDTVLVAVDNGWISQMAWHPDGSEILVAQAGEKGGIWTVTPDGQTVRDLFRAGGETPYATWAKGLAWSPDGSEFAVRLGVSHYDSISGTVISTATRTGDDWRVLATEGGASIWGLRFCNFPAQGPEYPHDLIPEEHCE